MKRKLFTVVMLVVVMAISLLAFTACNNNNGNDETTTNLRFVAPDGTPALAIAKMFTDNKKIGDYDMEYAIVPANSLASEMGTGSADLLIMPTNTGVQQIVKNGYDYKLVSVCVEGSLYIVGKPEKVGGGSVITLEDLKGKNVACIGEGGTPDLVFKYIVNNTDGINIGDGDNDIHVQYVSEAPQARMALGNGTADFAIVGEPAATAFGAAVGSTARLNIQAEYQKISGCANFPQASLFVKTSLTTNATFMSALKTAVEASANWVTTETPANVKAYMESDAVGSATTFPPASIARCKVCAKFVASDNNLQQEILTYLAIMGVNVGIFA